MSLEAFLKARVDFAFGAKFILDHGRYWPFLPLPKSIKPGPERECYRNAALLALGDPRFTYVEGYAAYTVPLLHAWCVDDAGNVLDVTWRSREGTPEYFGVPFRRSYLEKRRRGDALIDCAPEFELLHGLYPKADWYETRFDNLEGARVDVEFDKDEA